MLSEETPNRPQFVDDCEVTLQYSTVVAFVRRITKANSSCGSPA